MEKNTGKNSGQPSASSSSPREKVASYWVAGTSTLEGRRDWMAGPTQASYWVAGAAVIDGVTGTLEGTRDWMPGPTQDSYWVACVAGAAVIDGVAGTLEGTRDWVPGPTQASYGVAGVAGAAVVDGVTGTLEGTRDWMPGPTQDSYWVAGVDGVAGAAVVDGVAGTLERTRDWMPGLTQASYGVAGTSTLEGTRDWIPGQTDVRRYACNYIERSNGRHDLIQTAPAPVQIHGGGVVGIEGEAAPISAPSEPAITKVEQLRPQMTGVTLTLKVVSKKIVVKKGRKHGPRSGMQVAECLVGDETAIVVFKAKNEQVDMMNEGAIVTLRHAEIEMYKGSMRLVVNKSGRIEVAEPAGFTVNENNNISLVEFECVPVPA